MVRRAAHLHLHKLGHAGPIHRPLLLAKLGVAVDLPVEAGRWEEGIGGRRCHAARSPGGIQRVRAHRLAQRAQPLQHGSLLLLQRGLHICRDAHRRAGSLDALVRLQVQESGLQHRGVVPGTLARLIGGRRLPEQTMM